MSTASSQPQGQSDSAAAAASPGATTGSVSDAGELAAELAQLAEKLRRAENDLLREKAESENFRKRTRRDFDDQLRYAPLGLLKDLLPVVDNLQRAVTAGEKAQGAGLIDGVKIVVEQFLATLARHGCRQIPAEGAQFDPHLHEAIKQEPSAAAPAGQVALVVQSGYQFEERVVRPALVIVSSGPPAS